VSRLVLVSIDGKPAAPALVVNEHPLDGFKTVRLLGPDKRYGTVRRVLDIEILGAATEADIKQRSGCK
jgi:hypothetical protein